MILSTVIGNYPKIGEGIAAANIRQAIHRNDLKEIAEADLEAIYRENTERVLREQAAAGVDVLTDGQLRWEDIVTPFAARIEGFKINGLTRFFNNNVYYRKPIAEDRLAWKSPITAEAFRFAKSKTDRTLKAVLPAPFTFAFLSEDQHYHDERAFVLALADILNQEAKALEAAGAELIQFDDPALVFRKEKADLARAGIQKATAGLKAKKIFQTYFGDLEGISDFFADSDVDILGLDFVSTEGNWKVLRKKKFPKALQAGLVDARNTKLADPKALVRAIRELSEAVPALSVSPNCGLEFLPYASVAPKLSQMAGAVRECNAGRS